MAGTSPHFEPECAGPHHTSAQQAYNTRSGGYRPTEGVEGWSERGQPDVPRRLCERSEDCRVAKPSN